MTDQRFVTDTISPARLIGVLSWVADLAIADHRDGRKSSRSGKELCALYFKSWRHGHTRMLSGVYNKTRWHLQVQDELRATGGTSINADHCRPPEEGPDNDA